VAHIPVLLNEVLEYFDPKPGDNFIDCTVGEGGHALAILKMTAPIGRVLGIDRDEEMIERLRENAERLAVSDRLILEQGNFAQVCEIAGKHGFSSVHGVLFDFGISSWQLEESGAGFSFQGIEPLDMRFDRTGNTETASTIVNSWPEEAIRRVIWEFGEEKYARLIAKGIVDARKKHRVETTDQLVGIISKAIPRGRRERKINPATRTFQALRIAVNNELENVEKGIRAAISLLSLGGRVAAISFHSLEDRRVKNIFKSASAKSMADKPAVAPAMADRGGSLKILTKKPIRPTPQELEENPRARSAKLRVAERVNHELEIM